MLRTLFKRHQVMISSLLAILGLGILLPTLYSCTESKARLNFVYKDAPRSGVAAKIGGVEITEDELIGSSQLSFYEIKKREYDFKMDQLKGLIQEKLLSKDAEKAGLSLGDFIEKKVTKGKIKVSDADYKKFVAERRIPEGQINDALKERIMTFLSEEAKGKLVENYVAKLTASQPVEVFFSKPKLNVNIDLGTAPVWGSADAPVTIVEFSDFQCPFCEKAATTLSEVKKKYKGKIKVAFKHFPLSFHKDAQPAAEASMCAQEQGKFWEYHDIVFKNQKNLKPEDLEKYAVQAGANAKKYKECVEGKKYAAYVTQDMAYGDKIGIKSTPTFFINGQLLSGALPYEAFSDAVDEALSEKKKVN